RIDAWLDPDLTDKNAAQKLISGIEYEPLQVRAVSTAGGCCIERPEAILTGNLTGGTLPRVCLPAVPTASRRVGRGALDRVLTVNLPAKITCDRSMQQTQVTATAITA